MAEHRTIPSAFPVVHRTAVVVLFLMIAQPTFENTRALVTGTLVMGDVSASVSASKPSIGFSKAGLSTACTTTRFSQRMPKASSR